MYLQKNVYFHTIFPGKSETFSVTQHCWEQRHPDEDAKPKRVGGKQRT